MNAISAETRHKVLRASFMEQCVRASAASYDVRHPVLVVMARSGVLDCGAPWGTMVVVQGSRITDYTWERQRALGRRFRTLRAYVAGKAIPIPRALRYGY